MIGNLIMNRTDFFTFAVLALLPGLGVAAVPVANPQLSGPVSGGDHGAAFGALPADDLSHAGYSEAEYFYSGKASAYGNLGPWGVDGIWPAKPTTTADYKVRMLV